MRAGRLRHRVAIHAVTETINAYGEAGESWASIGSWWASVEPLTGAERQEATEVSPLTSHKIIIRYHSTITTKHRIVYDSRTFEIDAILDTMEKNKEMILLCKEMT